ARAPTVAEGRGDGRGDPPRRDRLPVLHQLALPLGRPRDLTLALPRWKPRRPPLHPPPRPPSEERVRPDPVPRVDRGRAALGARPSRRRRGRRPAALPPRLGDLGGAGARPARGHLLESAAGPAPPLTSAAPSSGAAVPAASPSGPAGGTARLRGSHAATAAGGASTSRTSGTTSRTAIISARDPLARAASAATSSGRVSNVAVKAIRLFFPSPVRRVSVRSSLTRTGRPLSGSIHSVRVIHVYRTAVTGLSVFRPSTVPGSSTGGSAAGTGPAV